MGLEIERKFLVVGDGWRGRNDGTPMEQGYLARDPDRTIRVRIAGERAWLNIKGRCVGLVRQEFEYPIPPAEAAQLLALCPPPLISKTRYVIAHEGHHWEVDEFSGDNSGLILAEVEMEHPEEAVALPAWVGAEVSDDPRYYNSNLSQNPYREWSSRQ